MPEERRQAPKSVRATIVFAAGIAVGLMIAVVNTSAKGKVAQREAVLACTSSNGDVNGDDGLDVTDAITILGHLFLGNPSTLLPLCVEHRNQLPATGQYFCYNGDEEPAVADCKAVPCAGQDAMYEAGCPPDARFVDNRDGTSTDTCTGLMWQTNTADIDADGMIVPTNDALSWCDALTYCEGLEYAGYDDWRLPNVFELHSITSYGDLEIAIVGGLDALASQYWSSTSVSLNPIDAFYVNFTLGSIGHSERIVRHQVRAVRSISR